MSIRTALIFLALIGVPLYLVLAGLASLIP